MDNPDVRLVVHWMAPPTPESYDQEAGGRGAGRQPQPRPEVSFPDTRLKGHRVLPGVSSSAVPWTETRNL